MAKNLKELLKNLTDYSSVTDDSRKVKNGSIFVAIKGATVDGHDFIQNAVANGAKVVVGEKDIKIKAVEYIRVNDSRDALGTLASAWYGKPSEKLKVIGVTGTKGKTTTVHLIYHILTSVGKKAGMVSSIVAKIGDKEIDTGFHVTSPDVISLHKFLKEMVDAGSEYAVIEVSSHGIDQKRIAGVKFEVGVLTNIAPEHLDYHGTFTAYKKAKLSFVNSARKKVVSPLKTDMNVLPGEFNNLNAETAIDTAVLLGINKNDALKAIYTFKLPSGRMEEIYLPAGIKINKGFRIFIDFAHTPESLEQSLRYLRTQTKNHLISVFGCAGERDPRKRSKMGKISSQIADLSVFTAEDPRSEDIFTILKTMQRNAKNFVSIPERGEAIAYALSNAKKGDLVAIFGKGHEKSMAYKGFEHPWSDREVIEGQFSDGYDDTSAIILAGGMGTRMKSPYPKVIHEICGRPMLSYTLENLRKIGIKDIVIVVSFKKELVKRYFRGLVKFGVQKVPKGGTADATKAGFQKISPKSKVVVVINGDDSAFYKPETIQNVILEHRRSRSTITFVSLEKSNPHGLGRIVRDSKGGLVGIVEEKDATEEVKKIREVNDGLYVFDRDWLSANLPKMKKNPITGEYYINDFIEIGLYQKKTITVYKLKDPEEWQGINTPEELETAQKKMEERLK